MAGNLPVPQGLEQKIVWANNGIPFALTILHFRHSVGQLHTQARADTLATLTRAAFTSSGLTIQLGSLISLFRVESRHMDANSDPWFIGTGAALAATGTGDLLPLATSLVVTSNTGLRGRSYSGRSYIVGFTEGANSPTGAASQAAADAAALFINTIRADAQSQLTLTMSVLSRWTTPPGSPPSTPPVERTPPILSDVISASCRDLRWDVQRRRAIPGI